MVYVDLVPSYISIHVEDPYKIYHPSDEVAVIIEQSEELRNCDVTLFSLTAEQTVNFTVNGQSIKEKYKLPAVLPMHRVLTLPDDLQPGQYDITMEPQFFSGTNAT